MVVTTNNKAPLQEAEKPSETSEIKAKTLLQIIEDIEDRTREALGLGEELKKIFRLASAAMNNSMETKESVDTRSWISCFRN